MMMIPLIDGDVLRYEVGAIGEKEDGPASFDFVAEVLDGRIRDICEAVGADKEPIIYLTGSGNFRESVAVSKPYKGQRKDAKPFHYHNLTAYLHNQYRVEVAEGMEADDLMAIEQTWQGDATVICTRDKDLRQVPGWHYGWECGAQREFELVYVDPAGWLTQKGKKVVGVGEIFFWYQMLAGDSVDNIPGVPGIGPVKAYKILMEDNGLSWESKVRRVYQDKELEEEYYMEQAYLLWMVREIDADGAPVMWKPQEEW